METTSEIMGKAFDRSLNRWRREKVGPTLALPAAPRRTHWTIAISREAGAGAGDIARVLAVRLGWEVYDRELLEAIASATHVRTELLESVDEKHRHWLTTCVATLFGPKVVSSDQYACYLAETVLALGIHGHCVIVGRGAAAILPPESTIRVRLVAPLADRVRRTMHKRNWSEGEARQYVETTDKQRAGFARARFHKEPGLFDVTINTSRFSTDECVSVIEGIVRSKETGALTSSSE